MCDNTSKKNRLATKRLNIAETKVFKTIIMNVLLTLTHSICFDEPVNVALAVEHRSADLEERDSSA